jgi:hypothetical protein
MSIKLKSVYFFTQLIGHDLPELYLHAQASSQFQSTGGKVDARCRCAPRGAADEAPLEKDWRRVRGRGPDCVP